MLIAKFVVALTWLVCLSSFVVSYPEPWALVLFWMTIALVVSHFMECLVFGNRVKAAGGNAALHYLQIFIFGYFHWKELPAE